MLAGAPLVRGPNVRPFVEVNQARSTYSPENSPDDIVSSVGTPERQSAQRTGQGRLLGSVTAGKEAGKRGTSDDAAITGTAGAWETYVIRLTTGTISGNH
jgi:hypothetical protein